MRKLNYQSRQSLSAKAFRTIAAATGILFATQSITVANVDRTRVKNNHPTTGNKNFLLAQTNQSQEILVPNPEILINGIPNRTTNPKPQFLPRAVAPPVGDIAISNINTTPQTLDLGTGAIVPRLVLREAPVREVLLILAKAAGLNLIFVDESGTTATAPTATPSAQQTISLDIENEAVQDVFNSVLLVSGLSANRRGSTIYVGTRLPDSASNLVSRTLRLNQVDSSSASAFLASQGAEVERLITPVREIIDPVTQRVVQRVNEPAELRTLKITGADQSKAPLLLAGLKVSADDRLNFVTLVGNPRQIEIASSFLTQLDARKRQVAVNVKVVDINLNNTEDYNSSFSFGTGDTFVSQESGIGALRLGGNTPPTNVQLNSALGRISDPPAIINPFADGDPFFDFNNLQIIPNFGVGQTIIDEFGNIRVTPGDAVFPRAFTGTGNNPFPFQAGITEYSIGTNDLVTRTFNPTTGIVSTTASPGTPGTVTVTPPSFYQYPNKFLALLQSSIQNGNAKILTDPTLIVQEGQEATVKLAQNIVTNFETVVAPDTNVVTTTARIEEVGLILQINVSRIDDNGFVNLSVAPTVSAPGEDFDLSTSAQGQPNTINLITKRELSSGLVRLRDAQTLILSGIIQETERTNVSKVPIFGDLPVIGALFRQSNRINNRAEVVVLVTPQILDDSDRSSFGYQYTPGRNVRKMLQRRGFPTQGYQ